VSNGYTKVFANLQEDNTGKVNISFTIQVNSVDVSTFNTWRDEVKTILGPQVGQQLDIHSGIATDPEEPGRFMSRYSLCALAYAVQSDYSTDAYVNHVDVPFGLNNRQPLRSGLILRSIYELNSSVLDLAGELTAVSASPNSEAFIPVSFFTFNDGRVVPFAGYRGPISLVAGTDETETQPSILAPVAA
jgi:hypothetical protein